MKDFPPLEACPAWDELARCEPIAPRAGSAGPLRASAPGVALDYSRQRVDAKILELLFQLARERGLEQRAQPAYTAFRAGHAAPEEIKESLSRMKGIAGELRKAGTVTRIVNLGVGGSDLGPRLLADALGDGSLDVRFAANLDPQDLERALRGADPASTLFVVVSRSFATPETLANAERARRWGGKRFIAVTANPEAASKFGAEEVLPMPSWSVGRFSVWSAAGFAAMCAIGPAAFEEFLAGAREIDAHAQRAPLAENLPMLMALLGAWNINFLGCTAHAVLPYAHALRLLPSHLQQLEMESNGKSVDRDGEIIRYCTAPVVFGAEGTPSQHSIHQLLHQGTVMVAADFLDFGLDEALSANLRAQADALARGSGDEGLTAERRNPGDRPSTILSFDGAGARTLGRLLALYEHKVHAQGLLWNLNSFDQWGVELGKQMARDILSKGK